MSLETFSIFYYGHEVTSSNNTIDFDEGFGELTAELGPGKYTLTDFAKEIAAAMNEAGTKTYSATVDRSTRLITINSTGTFSFLISSGSTVGTSAFGLAGFTGSDTPTASSHTGNLASGSEYRPQFILQSHIPPENFKRTVNASVNESASGAVEVVRFGAVRFMQCNIMFITDKKMDGIVIKNNQSGVSSANAFMDYITRIAPIEFMKDISDRDSYLKIQLESTPQSKDGIDYTLKENYDKGLPGIFETGNLTFRVLG